MKPVSTTVKTSPIRGSTIEVSSNGQVDLYHSVVAMSWAAYLSLFVAAFLVVNAVFGYLYYVGTNAIGGLASSSYWEYFFFSVQTLATIGYGTKFPHTMYADVLVTVEAMIGLLSMGLFAAIAFARLSIPRSRVIFSKTAVVADFEGVPTLMFRVANERKNNIIGAEVELSLFIRETSKEGLSMRRIYDLALVRSHNPMLSLTWLIFHPMNEASPVFGHTAQSLASAEFALVATLKGLDETISQTVHANYAYRSSDIRWNHRFQDMFTEDESTGKSSIDLTRIHDIRPVDAS
jgi:inward rectifier potassium channel